jgi:hypothetical protein
MTASNDQIKRVDTPHGRVYVVKTSDGLKIYPSVTTVLSSEQSPWLEKLATDIGEAELARISSRGMNRGTVMHTFLENYLVCLGYQDDPEKCLLYTQKKTAKELSTRYDEETVSFGRSLFYNMISSELFERMKKPLFSEKFLWSHEQMFAGTADFGYEDSLGRGDVIGDFKSASGIRTPEQVEKYCKQIGAYSIAYEEITGRSVHRGEVWISFQDGIQLVSLEGHTLKEYREKFTVLCENYHASWDKKPIYEYLKSLKSSKNV